MKYALAVALSVTLAVAGYSYTQHVRAEAATARLDSVREAAQDTLEARRQRWKKHLALWRDSADHYAARADSFERQMEAADEEFNALLADAVERLEAGEEVELPLLTRLERVHVETVQACRQALSSCRSRVGALTKELTVFRDTIYPTLDSARLAEKRARQAYERLASPGILVRMKRNLELVVGSFIVGGGVTCVLVC